MKGLHPKEKYNQRENSSCFTGPNNCLGRAGEESPRTESLRLCSGRSQKSAMVGSPAPLKPLGRKWGEEKSGSRRPCINVPGR